MFLAQRMSILPKYTTITTQQTQRRSIHQGQLSICHVVSVNPHLRLVYLSYRCASLLFMLKLASR